MGLVTVRDCFLFFLTGFPLVCGQTLDISQPKVKAVQTVSVMTVSLVLIDRILYCVIHLLMQIVNMVYTYVSSH